jgi:hypothetical protein
MPNVFISYDLRDAKRKQALVQRLKRRLNKNATILPLEPLPYGDRLRRREEGIFA